MARAAKEGLDGADIYSGCCTLKIEYAKVRRSVHFLSSAELPRADGQSPESERHSCHSAGALPSRVLSRSRPLGRGTLLKTLTFFGGMMHED